ncbi:MAG: nitroreductase family protein, partial [Caulobacterales bacterium]|nr:nitroreductase family protein [Caulobacterales bacterium]
MSFRPAPPAPPSFGDELSPSHPSTEVLALMAQRRSTPADKLASPGPSPDQVDSLLALAARVPDHGKLAPWRFVVF